MGSMIEIARAFDRFARFRHLCMESLDAAPAEIKETIAPGLRNNLHWQAGHLVVVQASLLYRRCGLEPPLGLEWFDSFGKGTSPANWSDTTPSYDRARERLQALIDTTRADLDRLADRKYPETITVTGGDRLSSFAEALEFLSVHEALHLGNINVIRRILAA
ncbi:hypothetical protein GF420_16125 [candidate division GN15 bacterium]|nr:hypothetical protein [candidate division GN15 bacterium]